MTELLLSAFSLGLGGSLHCAGMCGPLALAIGGTSVRNLGAYHLARLMGYSVAGAVLGAFSSQVTSISPVTGGVFGLLLAVLLLVVAFRVAKPSTSRLSSGLTQWVAKGQGAAMSLSPMPRALAMGCLTPLLPCGLLYAAFLLALSAHTVVNGAATMLVFALSSTPGIIFGHAVFVRISGWLGEKGRRRIQVATALVGAGVLLYRAYAVFIGGASCH